MPENSKSPESFNHVHAPDRATVVANRLLGIVEDEAKPAISDAVEIALVHGKNYTLEDVITDAFEITLYAARIAFIDVLRDEFADLERQTINENRVEI
jgi:hypothetical protein